MTVRHRLPLAVAVVAAAIYLVGAALWAYLIAANADTYAGSPGRWWLVLGALVLGAVVGRWPIVVVPLLLPLTAAGAGNGTNPDADIPIAGELMLIVAPVAAVAAATGVIVSQLFRRAAGLTDPRSTQRTLRTSAIAIGIAFSVVLYTVAAWWSAWALAVGVALSVFCILAIWRPS